MHNVPLKNLFPLFPDPLLDELERFSVLRTIPENVEILREGQYVKVIPVVVRGLIKVVTRNDDKELLLYYIKPNESCIMSFSSGLKTQPSPVFAITEEETDALLLPVDKLMVWVQTFPQINTLFFNLFSLRYGELLDTINHLLFEQLDKRLYDYLRKKAELTANPLKISHRQIASDLGTAREVISRIMKKLEHEGKVRQNNNNFIEIF
jgi:CRP/FNR family transcriptional regulator